MKQVPTADEFLTAKFQQYAKGIGNSYKDGDTLERERLIEFAKLHVEAALKKERKTFKAGVKFAQSKMYSEEEVYNLLEKVVKDVEQEQLNKHFSGDYRFLKEYFETIKKK
jgi:hypothetical protein